MPRAVRPPLTEWSAFAEALRDLVKGADMTNADFAQFLGRGYDRGKVGGILEARDPCPEEVLVRLYKRSAQARYEQLALRDTEHLHLLVHLWASAADQEPGPVLRAEMANAGTPWLREARPQTTVPAKSARGEKGTNATSRRKRIAVCVAAFILVAAVGISVTLLLGSSSTDRSFTGSEFSHSFQAEYAGPVHLAVTPLSDNVGLDHSVDLQWGRWSRHVALPDLPREGVTLLFTKIDAGTSFPLRIQVSPPAVLSVGAGDVAGGIDINTGWTTD